jgi:dynein heavy chain, axonemal
MPAPFTLLHEPPSTRFAVLDDNCTLCLPNGERVKLNAATMRMLFEVADLAAASPATVSRCGMVYVSPGELGWRPYVQSWVR